MSITKAQRNKKIAVLGLGKTGLATATALVNGGAKVTVWDDKNSVEVPQCHRENLSEIDLTDFDALVVSPGIPLTHPKPHPAVLNAKAVRLPIIGDVELLFAEHPKAPYIAITGTNGKSTVTALTGHLFETAGLKPGIGGNLGTAVLDITRDENAPFVLELSSYQLDLCQTTKFHISTLVNLSPDHLERHGSLQGYIQAKMKIFERQTLNDFAFISIDDEYCKSIFAALDRGGKHSVIPVSAKHRIPGGVSAVDGLLRFGDEDKALIDLKPLCANLPGQHNWLNAAFAAGIARAMGLRRDQIIAGLKTFQGLPHRQERVACINGVQFVNDSKATNADACQWALHAFKDIYWIVGGLAKDSGIDMLMDKMEQVRGVYLIGRAQDAFEKTFQIKGPKDIPSHKCGTLEKACELAYTHARQAGHGTVLLSPACASMDQFLNFEARGNAFKAIVADF